ncbi:Demethylphylloquinone methyltransferase [Hyphodiscus hymeniophilus]|uniref:Demethylphylloquinone methyltransferase n=1 Tax=Hyphodiscus hymeniophilus TaxID=353542 RepID=A0A9P6VMB9_9HELO|nr:Demethylphylloquinone methyltransferase [Hyphodiscus hymeniophilus]
MTSSTRLSTIEAIYNKRAPGYDSEGGFHPAQAADYLKWMDLKPGQHVLDLACGTGAITVPAAELVGSSGKVVGVDISGDSLVIARSKAEKKGISVAFVHHDIAHLDGLEEIKEGSFDVISCAAAFVLLEDSASAVKGWAKLLKVGGVMIFDVLTPNSMVANWVLNVVGDKLNIEVNYGRTKLDSVKKVKALLTEAGLDDSDTFVSDSYSEKEVDAKDPGGMFEDMVGRKGWSESVHSGFLDPARKPLAKEMFCKEIEKLADKDGKILEEMKVIMAVGKKV